MPCPQTHQVIHEHIEGHAPVLPHACYNIECPPCAFQTLSKANLSVSGVGQWRVAAYSQGSKEVPSARIKLYWIYPDQAWKKCPPFSLKDTLKKGILLLGSNLHVNNNPNSGAGAGKCTTQISILNKDVIRTKLLFFAYLCLATGRLNASIG